MVQLILAFAFSVFLNLPAPTTAHTRFTTLFVDGVDQGDFKCVRMDPDVDHTTDPIASITSADMACGRSGEIVVSSTCAVNPGSTVSFLHREWIDASQPGVIDESHTGPCSVYMKKQVSTISSTSTAAGDGWFKIFAADYDTPSGLWCTEKVIAENGLLSAIIPHDLPAGEYLVRVELLPLQNAVNGDPQFYIGCAQIAVQAGAGGGTAANATVNNVQTVNIPDPGYVNYDMAAMQFNIYDSPMKLPYPMFGPPVYGSSSAVTNGGGSSGLVGASSPFPSSSPSLPSSSKTGSVANLAPTLAHGTSIDSDGDTSPGPSSTPLGDSSEPPSQQDEKQEDEQQQPTDTRPGFPPHHSPPPSSAIPATAAAASSLTSAGSKPGCPGKTKDKNKHKHNKSGIVESTTTTNTTDNDNDDAVEGDGESEEAEKAEETKPEPESDTSDSRPRIWEDVSERAEDNRGGIYAGSHSHARRRWRRREGSSSRFGGY